MVYLEDQQFHHAVLYKNYQPIQLLSCIEPPVIQFRKYQNKICLIWRQIKEFKKRNTLDINTWLIDSIKDTKCKQSYILSFAAK